MDHAAVCSKALDHNGIGIIKEGFRIIRKIMKPETSGFTPIELQGYLDSVIYIFFLYNRNSVSEYSFEEEYPECPKINEWANFIIDRQLYWTDEKFLKDLKETDYDQYISSFGKVLFFKLVDQFVIYTSGKNPHKDGSLSHSWIVMIMKLVTFYCRSLIALRVIAETDELIGL